MLGKDDFYLNSPPQHINYFTPRTLSRLLVSGGFQIEILESAGGLKWENLIGRPIISEIADAYRAPNERIFPSDRSPRTGATFIRKALGKLSRDLLYKRAKLGMNLVTVSRPARVQNRPPYE